LKYCHAPDSGCAVVSPDTEKDLAHPSIVDFPDVGKQPELELADRIIQLIPPDLVAPLRLRAKILVKNVVTPKLSAEQTQGQG